jgi:DNA-binding Lrp family transcriptional regulator
MVTKTKLLDDLDEDIVNIVDSAGKIPLRDVLKPQDVTRQLEEHHVSRQTILYRVKWLAKEGYIGIFHTHQRIICYSMSWGAE